MFVPFPLKCKLLRQGLFLNQYLPSAGMTIFIRACLPSWTANSNSQSRSVCSCASSQLEIDSAPGSKNPIRKDHNPLQPRLGVSGALWLMELPCLCPSLSVLTGGQGYTSQCSTQSHSFVFQLFTNNSAHDLTSD